MRWRPSRSSASGPRRLRSHEGSCPEPFDRVSLAVEATYAPDAAEARVPFRAEHLARVVALKEAGVFVEVGAFLDVSGAILVVRADSADAALEIVRDDVYLRNGVWVELRARAFGRVASPEPGAG